MQTTHRQLLLATPLRLCCLRQRFYHKQTLTNAVVQKKRTELFSKEAKRQAALITDIEKIEVKYYGHPEDCTLIMNKNMSTPFNCAQHINQMILERSVVAEVDGQVWDMHRPLEDNCGLRFLHFRQNDPYYANKAFWRSASLMLGAVLESVFKDNIYVELCSFPSPNVRSGSFVYDVDLKITKWEPTKEELRILSGEMVKLAMASHRFERLEVDANLALKIFSDNHFKRNQIPHIAAQSSSGNTVVVYRMGTFVEISCGPMISNTSHLGKVSVASVHPIETNDGQLFRVQGVALPRGFMLNHFSYGLLEKRAQRLNSGRIPVIPTVESLPPQQELSAA
ncbi:39S ribosomal protein L39, mitochondrial-like [Homarus americanus]|uniref:Large ribosomal subunit protein mL39 n=1 Tax=Homarus americanus TaxID=6706 RepID=A0A8J5JX31_HOMAM|nr:39S ribosomal protein L39, mitochondrial-like [Homarus americanus]KAG7165402.1 39S ribosomal protein L39-like [Homarus americanus]